MYLNFFYELFSIKTKFKYETLLEVFPNNFIFRFKDTHFFFFFLVFILGYTLILFCLLRF